MVTAISKYSQDVEKYRIIFSFYTEDKNIYIAVRVLLVVLIFAAGVVALKKAKKS